MKILWFLWICTTFFTLSPFLSEIAPQFMTSSASGEKLYRETLRALRGIFAKSAPGAKLPFCAPLYFQISLMRSSANTARPPVLRYMQFVLQKRFFGHLQADTLRVYLMRILLDGNDAFIGATRFARKPSNVWLRRIVCQPAHILLPISMNCRNANPNIAVTLPILTLTLAKSA